MLVDNLYLYPHMARIPFNVDWVDSMLDLEGWIESSGVVDYCYKHNHIAFKHERDLVLFLLRFG
jgi:hypothetical protein